MTESERLDTTPLEDARRQAKDLIGIVVDSSETIRPESGDVPMAGRTRRARPRGHPVTKTMISEGARMAGVC